MRYLFILLLAGCSALEQAESPREYDCMAICEGCERCEITCETQGRGIETKSIELEQRP